MRDCTIARSDSRALHRDKIATIATIAGLLNAQRAVLLSAITRRYRTPGFAPDDLSLNPERDPKRHSTRPERPHEPFKKHVAHACLSLSFFLSSPLCHEPLSPLRTFALASSHRVGFFTRILAFRHEDSERAI